MACYRFTPPKTNKNGNPRENWWFGVDMFRFQPSPSPWQLCFRSTAESRREVASDEEDFEERVPGQDVRFQNLGFFGGSSQLGGGFKHDLCSPIFREDSHFDQYFSDGLKPPGSQLDDNFPTKKITTQILIYILFNCQSFPENWQGGNGIFGFFVDANHHGNPRFLYFLEGLSSIFFRD